MGTTLTETEFRKIDDATLNEPALNSLERQMREINDVSLRLQLLECIANARKPLGWRFDLEMEVRRADPP